MPDEENNSFQSGMRALKNKQYDEAVIHFTNAIQEKSDIHKAYNALGVTYSKTGNKKEAEKCFEKALILDPYNLTYEKNLGKVIQKNTTESDGKFTKQGSRSGWHTLKVPLMIAISLIVLVIILFFLMLVVINFQSEMNPFGNGSNEGGLVQPLISSLIREEPVYPIASVTVQNKKILYLFDQHQDLSQIKKIEAYVSLPDGTKTNFPVVTNPQKNLYYGIDDPFFGKDKRFILTGYFRDDTQGVIADTELPPR